MRATGTVTLRETSAIPTGRGIVGDVALSPNGEHVVALHGGFRSNNWKSLFGVTFVGSQSGAVPVPALGRPAYVLDDARAVLFDVDGTKIDAVFVEDGELVRREDCLVVGSLSLLACARIDATRVVLEIEDADYGHGWSPIVYTRFRRCVDLVTGAITDGALGHVHLHRAPGSVFITPNQDAGLRFPELPFRKEWPKALGVSRFLTDLRVFDIASGATLLNARGGVFEDLSANEQVALAVTDDGALELWHVSDRHCLVRTKRDGDGFECARFVGPMSAGIVAGTSGGFVVRFAVEDRK